MNESIHVRACMQNACLYEIFLPFLLKRILVKCSSTDDMQCWLHSHSVSSTHYSANSNTPYRNKSITLLHVSLIQHDFN